MELEKLVDIIVAFKPAVDEQLLLSSQHLIDDGILDSLDILQLIVTLESSCSVKIDYAALSRNDFISIDNICQMVKRFEGTL